MTLSCSTLLLAAALSSPARASDGADCATPRAAADSIFIFQRPERYDLERASACLDAPPGARAPELAVQLREVLDARGLYVPVTSLPDVPDYLDEAGVARVALLPDDLPELTVERGADGSWRYSRALVERIPGLYAETFSDFSRWFQRRLPPFAFVRLGPFAVWQGLYAALLLVFAWTAGRLTQAVVRGQVVRVVRRLGLDLDASTYRRTQGPLVFAAMAAVLAWGVPDLQLPIALSRPLLVVVGVVRDLAGVALLLALIDLAALVASSWARRSDSKLDDQLVPLLRQAGRAVSLGLGALLVLDAVGVDVWKLAAGVGIGGLAFALAAQDTVANVLGSVNIFIDKPFQIGDWVKIGDVEGTVEEVGFRSTRVRTFYNSLVTIPNSKIMDANVDNLGVRPRRRVKLTLGLTYDTPPEKVQAYVEGVRAILTAHPQVQASYEVHFYDLGASALEILVYYHLVVDDWSSELEARAQNLLEFLRLADALGVSFAFPSTSVYVASTPERPLTPHEARSLAELQEIAASFGPDGARARPGGVPFTKSWSIAARTHGGPG
jgi:MscS family membrane protein